MVNFRGWLVIASHQAGVLLTYLAGHAGDQPAKPNLARLGNQLKPANHLRLVLAGGFSAGGYIRYVLSIFIHSEHNIGYTSAVIQSRQLNQIGKSRLRSAGKSLHTIIT